MVAPAPVSIEFAPAQIVDGFAVAVTIGCATTVIVIVVSLVHVPFDPVTI